MINDPFHPDEAIARERDSNKRTLLAVVCAVALTAILLVGYGIIRKYHAMKVLAENTPPPPAADAGPKGPALAHVMLDEASIAKGMTTIGGVVKNISKQDLTGVSVVLEMRRKDGGVEESILPVTPSQLQPEQEGSYSATLPAHNLASIRLAGLKADPKATLIAYTSSPGKKRTPERLEPKTVVVKRTGKPGEFINSPDNPGRIP